MSNRLRFVALTLGLIAVQCAFAQSQAINGSIRGRVTDSAGASVAQASVAIANVDTGFTRSLKTGEEGYYVFPNLPLGTYTVTIEKTGFATQRHTGVILQAGTEGVVDGKLEVGAVATTVEVTGGADVLEPSRVSTGRTIDHTE